jgi:ribosomal protein L11 methyltransferase
MATITALVLSIPASEAELASDVLWALGVAAVEERTPNDSGTEDHLVELWTSLGNDVEQVTRALEGLPARWRWHLVDVDESVVHTWRAHARPTWVMDDVVVVPAWFDGELGPSAHHATQLVIDPGEAFGMGDHPTTVASLRALRQVVFPGATVLDVGCGSGILAIAALRFGAVRAEAIDVADVAVTATMDNARRNGVADRLGVSTTPLAELDGTFDVVVANILAPVLRRLAPDLDRALEPDGVLIVSGLLADRYQDVVEALAPLHLVDVHPCEGWVALTFRR